MENEERAILLRRAIHDGKAFDFQNYHTNAEVNLSNQLKIQIEIHFFKFFQINAYLTDLAATSPLVSTSVIGKTYESMLIILNYIKIFFYKYIW